MNPYRCLLPLPLLAALAHGAVAAEPDPAGAGQFADESVRLAAVEQLRTAAEAARTSAWKRAAAEGWQPRGYAGGRRWELQSIENGVPRVYIEDNVNAAISTAANLIRNTSPYNLNGTGVVVGVWDGGGVRTTHQELTGRVTIMDGAALVDHSTHVGGTIGASGVSGSALGMAPKVRIDSYEWTSDSAEMATRGMATNAQSGRLPLSNHSYGTIAGWYYDSATATWYWYGTWGNRESEYFGMYDSQARAWDTVVVNAPYYLPLKSAGNDRTDSAPANGVTFNYYSGGWVAKAYNSATDPYNDYWDSGGYDTISTVGVAKNVLTVGAVNDAVSAGVRSLAAAGMTTFSSWGPADDGRIKPDVVANGLGLYSCLSGSDTAYGTYSGTSMATPNACGSAALLIEWYARLSGGKYLRASTLKGLIIHTADDLGTAGPDYANGWGLMNTKAAADLMKRRFDFNTNSIREDFVSTTLAARTNNVTWDGSNALRVTVCWTDPAGTARTTLDVTTPCLVNNLDLRVIGPDGSTNFPYMLNRTNPTAIATTGDNNLDNVEQVYLATPSGTGDVSIVVSRDGTLTGTTQYYSLVVSGIAATPAPTSTVTLTVTGFPANISSAVPGYGVTSLGLGTFTQAVVAGSFTSFDAVSRSLFVSTGWVGNGSVPAGGIGTNTGYFTLNTSSTVTWRWVVSDLILSNQTVVTRVTNQPRDTLTARDGYSVQSPGGGLLQAGQYIRLQEGFQARTGAELRIRSP